MNLNLKKAQNEPKFFQVLRDAGREQFLMKCKEVLEESDTPYEYILSDASLLSNKFFEAKLSLSDRYPYEYGIGDLEWELDEADKYAYKKELYDMPGSAYWGKHQAVWYFVFPTDATSQLEPYFPDVDLGDEDIGEYPVESPIIKPEAHIVGIGYIDGPTEWCIWARSNEVLMRARRFIGAVWDEEM